LSRKVDYLPPVLGVLSPDELNTCRIRQTKEVSKMVGDGDEKLTRFDSISKAEKIENEVLGV
jgi:hypothetical protein